MKRNLPARMRPVLADALRSEPEIAATLSTIFAGAASAVEASMSDVSESGWVVTSSSYLGVGTLQRRASSEVYM